MFVIEKRCVFFEVGAEFLNIIKILDELCALKK
jgi:hypothetical protein